MRGTDAHEFFKSYGERLPKESWNHPGTKQGIYMIGPDGEALEGAHAYGDVKRVRERLKVALQRFKELRKKKRYKNKPVPMVSNVRPPEMVGRPLVFRVFLRDLPRARGDEGGRRFRRSDFGRMWLEFVKWAWNVNWIAFDEPGHFVPVGRKEQPVHEETALRICREVLVDNVRGQNVHWTKDHVEKAQLTMKRLQDDGGLRVIEYRGEALMRDGERSYAPTLYGRATYDAKKRAFRTFELVAIGERRGAGRFNQRGRDKGPAPMGIALVQHTVRKAKKRRER